MKRVGIFGGTFNPVHLGHLALAETVREKIKLDKIIFVPSFQTPLKSTKGLIAGEHRFQMVKLETRTNSYFEVSDFEIQRKQRSYSIDTVRYFRDKFDKNVQLYFLIGEDQYNTLARWKNIGEMIKLAKFVVVNRFTKKSKRTRLSMISVTMPNLEISASYIRQNVKKGKSIKYFVSEKVRAYILEKRLYTN